jgi:hypothetical protein
MDDPDSGEIFDTVHMAWNIVARNRSTLAQWITISQSVLFVMAGLDPAIHGFSCQARKRGCRAQGRA